MIRVIRNPFSAARRRRLDVRDVQGDILRGYGLAVSRHLFIEVHDPVAGRAVLAEALDSVTSGATWSAKPESTVNVAITHGGLAALGAPDWLLDSFPEAFVQGMAARAELLGDTGRSHPSQWNNGLGTGRAHVLFTVNACDTDALQRAVEPLIASFTRHGVEIASDHSGARLPDRTEHFGYTDGVGQPAIEGTGDPVRGQGDMGSFRTWSGLPVGEIFHGFIDDDGDPSPGPAEPFDIGGTFKVWRKLHEDVATFRSWVAEQASRLDIDEQLLRAKLVGRWPDATPIVLSPDGPDPAIANDPDRVNDFDYSDDPHGERCPYGAHIRRANPRAGLGFSDALTSRQRIIRRGMTYGPPLQAGEPDDGEDRGIFFVAYMADIERQFEFIQRNWCNDGDVVDAGHDRDPIIGRAPGDHKFVIPGPRPKYVHPLAEPVRTHGGEYLWVPSMTGLRRIATGFWSDTLDGPAGRPHPDPPSRMILTSPGSALGAMLAPVAVGLAYATGRRVVHPVGASFDGTLEVFDPGHPLLDGTVLGTPAEHPVIVRMSRGYGRKLFKRDVHGFALRIPDADGRGHPQDLLLASVGVGPLGREMTSLTMRYEPTFSTTLRVAVPNGKVVFKVRPRQSMPGDAAIHSGAGRGLRFDLLVGEKPRDVRVVGCITLGEARSASRTADLAFSLTRDAGNICSTGVLNAARTVAYPASHLGRRLRRRGLTRR